MSVCILTGDVRERLKDLPDESVHCVVTSPPYWGLRDYGVVGQIGLESSFAAYVEGMVAVFRDVRRVLRADGTLWLNLGDSYATGTSSGRKPTQAGKHGYWENPAIAYLINGAGDGLKPKDLAGIPWRVAFALQADGWYLRQDIIWSKPNPMPESVRDRCTKAHEYLFLLSKSERYYFDQEAILEPVASATVARLSQENLPNQQGSDRVPGKTNGRMKAVGRSAGNKTHKYVAEYEQSESEEHRTKAGFLKSADKVYAVRNPRSVWTVTTRPFKEAHFATFPPKLIEPCILAGCPEGGTVLDPFFGAGTTGLVCQQLNRNCIGIELNPEYVKIAERRLGLDLEALCT